MENSIKKCDVCGEELKPSQFAKEIREGEEPKRRGEVLVCRNFPDCPKAEKEITGTEPKN